ncbi:MAG: molybdopterin-guanine dinucleotide biosynthesis protein MobA [Methanosphaera stadtmanae]|nr:molybdopterin-guanine dinucleotide biosynthesis protein MobA [Methanosphaera stadtmanae]
MDCVITAAGKNSRMINDFIKMNQEPIHKLKLEINNKPILVHTIEKVLNANIEQVIITLGYFKEEIYDVLEEYDLLDNVTIKTNPQLNVDLSKTIENSIKDNTDNYYLFMAADQPTITSQTINKLINIIDNCENPENTLSVLRRRKTGWLDSAEGLGMPFCCYGKLLYKYVINENSNLNPILRKMIKNNVKFYGVKEANNFELMNINQYHDYLTIKKEFERK